MRFGCENRKGEVRRYANSVLPLTSLSAFQAVDFWLRSDASYKLLPEEVDLLLDFRFPVRWYVDSMKVSCLFTLPFCFFFLRTERLSLVKQKWALTAIFQSICVRIPTCL